MTNYNYDMQRNTELNSIDRSIRKVNQSINDQTYLQAYGKEAYIEMIEKRRFRKQLICSGISAFLIGFFGVGLYMCNWNMNVLFNSLAEKFMSLF